MKFILSHRRKPPGGVLFNLHYNVSSIYKKVNCETYGEESVVVLTTLVNANYNIGQAGLISIIAENYCFTLKPLSQWLFRVNLIRNSGRKVTAR